MRSQQPNLTHLRAAQLPLDYVQILLAYLAWLLCRSRGLKGKERVVFDEVEVGRELYVESSVLTGSAQ